MSNDAAIRDRFSMLEIDDTPVEPPPAEPVLAPPPVPEVPVVPAFQTLQELIDWRIARYQQAKAEEATIHAAMLHLPSADQGSDRVREQLTSLADTTKLDLHAEWRRWYAARFWLLFQPCLPRLHKLLVELSPIVGSARWQGELGWRTGKQGEACRGAVTITKDRTEGTKALQMVVTVYSDDPLPACKLSVFKDSDTWAWGTLQVADHDAPWEDIPVRVKTALTTLLQWRMEWTTA